MLRDNTIGLPSVRFAKDTFQLDLDPKARALALLRSADNNLVPLANPEFIAFATAGREHLEALHLETLHLEARTHKDGLAALSAIAAVETYP